MSEVIGAIGALLLLAAIGVIRLLGWLSGLALVFYTAHLNLGTGFDSLFLPKWLLIAYTVYICIYYLFALETSSFKEFLVSVFLGVMKAFSQVAFGYLIAVVLTVLEVGVLGISQGEVFGIVALLVFVEVPTILSKVIVAAHKK